MSACPVVSVGYPQDLTTMSQVYLNIYAEALTSVGPWGSLDAFRPLSGTVSRACWFYLGLPVSSGLGGLFLCC